MLSHLHNNGNGTFTELGLSLPGIASGEAQWADYDGDGFLDIFVSGCASRHLLHPPHSPLSQ